MKRVLVASSDDVNLDSTTHGLNTEPDTHVAVISSTHPKTSVDFSFYPFTDEERSYLLSLSYIEQQVCFIAIQHLESSFDLSRSSGFIAWQNKK